MNIALILAGGTDPDFQMSVPKQFVNVFNRPVITYTLEIFQNHKDIDAIMVACLDGWQEMVRSYAKQFNIDKLKWVISGGKDGQASAGNGITALRKECRDDDIREQKYQQYIKECEREDDLLEWDYDCCMV